jgi:hypothetical protein
MAVSAAGRLAPADQRRHQRALALAIGLTDPTTDVSLLDFLRGRAKAGTLDLMVTGHSLGGALAIVATAWLNDQLPKVEPLKFSLWPQTFAAPTMWNAAFATNFAETFTYSAAVNSNDVVPMGWANLNGVLATYPAGTQFVRNGLVVVRGDKRRTHQSRNDLHADCTEQSRPVHGDAGRE